MSLKRVPLRGKRAQNMHSWNFVYPYSLGHGVKGFQPTNFFLRECALKKPCEEELSTNELCFLRECALKKVRQRARRARHQPLVSSLSTHELCPRSMLLRTARLSQYLCLLWVSEISVPKCTSTLVHSLPHILRPMRMPVSTDFMTTFVRKRFIGYLRKYGGKTDL